MAGSISGKLLVKKAQLTTPTDISSLSTSLALGELGLTYNSGATLGKLFVGSGNTAEFGVMMDSQVKAAGSSVSTGETATLSYLGTSSTTAGHFNSSSTSPSSTTRLNYNGNFYANTFVSSSDFTVGTSTISWTIDGTSNFVLKNSSDVARFTLTSAGALSSITSISGPTYNGLTLTSAADGFTIAGGTTSRTLAVSGANKTISGLGTTLNIDNSLDIAGTTGQITLGSSSHTLSFTTTGNTSLTLPTSGTLATTASSLTNPMTAQGDMIYGGASGAATRLPLGTASQILVAGATAPAWANVADEVEWEFVSSAYSSSGAAVNPVTSSQSLTDYEYKVVFFGVTNAEDSNPTATGSYTTIRINGLSATNYNWIYTRVTATGTDTVTESNTADTASATYIDTGLYLNDISSGGTGFATSTRMEIYISPWDVALNSNHRHIAVSGHGSTVFSTQTTAPVGGHSVSSFSGTVSANTATSSLTSVEITHALDAGGTDEAAAYLYRRKKGF